MTKFPDLPPLPDLAAPFKKLAEHAEQTVDSLNHADTAGQRIQEAAKIAKDSLERFLKRKPFA